MKCKSKVKAGFVADQGGVGSMLKKGAGMLGGAIGGNAGDALQ